MTDNEKLARFQGWGHIVGIGWCSPNADDSMHEYLDCPDYLNDDAAAMSLLDTLVEKGYQPKLSYEAYVSYKWSCRVWQPRPNAGWTHANTRREAVVAAVLEMIEKEDV